MDAVSTRQQQILERLRKGGEVSVADLVGRLAVSDMTVRRDLVHLEKMGRVARTWGGVRIADRQALDFSFRDKTRRRQKEKEAIGRAAADLVKSGDTVFLDTGSTALQVARALRDRDRLRVYTCSLPIVAELLYCDGIGTIMLGGTVRPDSLEVYGPLTERNFAGLRPDIAFIGADAVSAGGELYTFGMEAGRVAELIMAASRRTVLVADSSKWDGSAGVKYGDIEAVQGVITDSGLPAARRRSVRALGVELTVV